MENNENTVASQLVEMLGQAGVKHVYGITGDSLNGITDAISRDANVRFIHMRHEESGAFAASAEAQLTDTIGCCAGSSGPGHIHLINGLYDAQRSGAPVLALASTCPSSMFGTGYFQETNPILLFNDCSVYNQMATTAAQLPTMLQAAMQEAYGKGGVGVVAIPADLNSQTAAAMQTAGVPLRSDRMPQPSADELKQAADIVNNAKTVAIYAGCGCKHCLPQLMEVARLLQAPIATTFKSQMCLTGGNPYYVGHIGYMGMWSAQEAIDTADATLLIGENFPFVGEFPTDKQLIQVDVRAERLGRRANVCLGIRSDARVFLSALASLIKPKTDSSFLQKAVADFNAIEQKMAEPVLNPGKPGCIRPEFMIDTLNRLAPDNCIFTVDTGMNCVWASHYLKAGKGRQMVGSFTHGSMANAMPMAIGASLAMPDRMAIGLCGDGGLAMLMGDLLTIIQYKLPVKLLVADNRQLAYVKWEMELAGFTPSQTDLQNPDFAVMARSMGFWAQTVTDPSQLETVMKQWLSAPGPALLSVTTDPDAASFTFSKEMMLGASPSRPVENFRLPGA